MAQQKLSALFGIPAPDTLVLDVQEGTPNVPVLNANYVFDPMMVKKALMWFSPRTPSRNMFLFGDAGTGKTSFVQQVAARLGCSVWSISCSGKTRFEDLLGTQTTDDKGGIVFVDGPLTAAIRAAAIGINAVFIGNEISRMDPGEQMRMVDVMDDENGVLTVPATGETIAIPPSFRAAFTGNSGGFGDQTAAYAGEKKGSIAFYDRGIKINFTGLTVEKEVEMLTKQVPQAAPTAKMMVDLARELRRGFAAGSFQFFVSPRGLVRWAKTMACYNSMSGIGSPIKEAFCDAILNGAPQEEVQAAMELFDNWFSGKKTP